MRVKQKTTNVTQALKAFKKWNQPTPCKSEMRKVEQQNMTRAKTICQHLMARWVQILEEKKTNLLGIAKVIRSR